MIRTIRRVAVAALIGALAAGCSATGHPAPTATVPATAEVLNASTRESVRVMNTRCVEYLTLPHKVGRFCGKKRGSWCSREAKRKVLKKLFDEDRAIFWP